MIVQQIFPKIFLKTNFHIYVSHLHLAEAHGNALASLQDTRGNIMRLQLAQQSMEGDLAEKLKNVDSLNNQMKVNFYCCYLCIYFLNFRSKHCCTSSGIVQFSTVN